MYYPEDVIEQVRENSDILSIISEYTHLTKKGNSYFGLCPFHNEKTPSFSVNEEKQMYYCFGCGAGGNSITYMMQKENMNFVEAIKYLAEKAHIDIEEASNSQEEKAKNNLKTQLLEIHKETAKFFYYSLKSNEHQDVMNYLLSRGINIEMIKHFGIGYAPSDYTILYNHLKSKDFSDEVLLQSGLVSQSKKSQLIFDRFSERIMFPIFNVQKKVIAFGGRVLGNNMPKYLNSPETALFNKSATLYGLNFARNTTHEEYILVEGYMDVIAMHQAGFTQTVASLGTAFTASHAKLLKRYTNQVVIMYDSDLAGVNATFRAIPILKKEGLKVKVLHLKDYKDPDEYIKHCGREKMEELLKHAKSDTWFKIARLEKEYRLEDADEKIKFLQQVAILISEIESSIEQNIYSKEIATQYDIDISALEVEIKKHYNNLLQSHHFEKKPIQITRPLHTQPHMPMVLLSAIYHYPYVYPYIKDYISPDLFEGNLLQELSDNIFLFAEENRPIDMGYFTAKYLEIEEQAMISNILLNKDQRYEDISTLEKMVNESIKRLNNAYIEKKLKNVTQLTEVQILLSKKKQLDKLYIALING